MNFLFISPSFHYLLETNLEDKLSIENIERLSWLLEAQYLESVLVQGPFVGTRREMLTPWSSNASDIFANAGMPFVIRVERFRKDSIFDPMLEQVYPVLDLNSLKIESQKEKSFSVEDIAALNRESGLALSQEEIDYLEKCSKAMSRKLSDVEIHSFAQINSEHCRHKIFNGQFVIDGKEKEKSLFAMIKETSKKSPKQLVSAYKDNVAFFKGPKISHFAPTEVGKSSHFDFFEQESVLSLKAETHNFPTTVEPFFGASTGSGGEIRDRMAGGKGSMPLAGTAVYMTSYSRLKSKRWESSYKERDWKYQTPAQILVKASNGASDFGNKFGQPLICGSLLTFEGKAGHEFYAYDRVVMLAGGVGFALAKNAIKGDPKPGDSLVLLGGENFRIGMGGGSVSSVDTGALSRTLELSAVQRANPEVQKRAYNVVRSFAECANNPIISIHDHGAGGHVNCFTELLEHEGGRVFVDRLPLGDPTLSDKEIICNESQERMGLVVSKSDFELLRKVALRERAPIYQVGEVVGDKKVQFIGDDNRKPIDLPLDVLLGSSPHTILLDDTEVRDLEELRFNISSGNDLLTAIKDVLSFEAVACKDWLTNKVDRSVTGLVACQQTVGPLQLPLANLGISALDYLSKQGVATSIGHSPVAGLLNEKAGARLSLAEALTNIVWAPLVEGIDSIVLSANWMWPAGQKGENARLYNAVEALSEFAQELGVSVPTGKDSLSMTMKYSNTAVKAPGTVVVSAAGSCSNIISCVKPDLKSVKDSSLVVLDFSGQRENYLGGSCFAQSLSHLGNACPDVVDALKFKTAFNFVQDLVRERKILAGHDISSGGLIVSLMEMSFAGNIGLSITPESTDNALVAELFCEKPGVVLQLENSVIPEVLSKAKSLNISIRKIATLAGNQIELHANKQSFKAPVAELRRTWFAPSYDLDTKQTLPKLAKQRFEKFDTKPLHFSFPDGFSGLEKDLISKIPVKERKSTAAIVREKGTNGDREMAFALYAAGFNVKDITTVDLISGDEDLSDVTFLVFPGGFSNSDVLGAAKGWAASFKYNEKAKKAIDNFYARKDTLSLGVCNGCQLMTALEIFKTPSGQAVKMADNESGKFESSFLAVKVEPSSSIMLKPLEGCQLGIWVAHGEGKFCLPDSHFDLPLRYVSEDYPFNPNGSDNRAAAVVSRDGRHLAMMPHLERSIFSWNWAYTEDKQFEVSPWILAFQAARKWTEG